MPVREHAERWIALASGFAALLALGVSTYNVYLQRQQIRAQVWPRLAISTANIGSLRVNLANHGVGPAQIRSVVVTCGGKPVRDWSSCLAALRAPPVENMTTSYLDGRVVGATEKFDALTLEGTKATAEIFEQIDLTVCYCSVLEDCWVLTYRDETKAIESCTPSPNQFKN